MQEGIVPNCMEFGVKCLKRSLNVLERICGEKFVLESDMFCRCLQVFINAESEIMILINAMLVIIVKMFH